MCCVSFTGSSVFGLSFQLVQGNGYRYISRKKPTGKRLVPATKPVNFLP